MFVYLSVLLAVVLILFGAVLAFRSQRSYWHRRGRERLIFVRNNTLF